MVVLSFCWQTDLSSSFEGKKVSDTNLSGASIAKDGDLQALCKYFRPDGNCFRPPRPHGSLSRILHCALFVYLVFF